MQLAEHCNPTVTTENPICEVVPSSHLSTTRHLQNHQVYYRPTVSPTAIKGLGGHGKKYQIKQ